MRKKIFLIVFAVFFWVSGCSNPVEQILQEYSTEQARAVSIMVLGSEHFSGSVSDVVNTQPDNVLSAGRQEELAAIALALAKFNPTVIVTERVSTPPEYIDSVFPEFNAEMLRTDPDERVQIAYRVASLLNIARVHGLDEQPSEGEPEYFPFGKLTSHIAETGQQHSFDQYMSEFRATMEKGLDDVKHENLAIKLQVINSAPYTEADFYYSLLRFDVGEKQPAAELNAYWFMRNAKIFSKMQDVTKPGDRVLIVFGAGHKYWLTTLAEETPGYENIDPLSYLRAIK